jgi:hypothetical protein
MGGDRSLKAFSSKHLRSGHLVLAQAVASFFRIPAVDETCRMVYIFTSTPSGPLPQGMHTSGGFLVFAPAPEVQK